MYVPLTVHWESSNCPTEFCNRSG